MHVLDRFDPAHIRSLCERGLFFWLDLEAPTDEEINELGEILDLPPLAVEDTREFHQRAKVDDYGDRLLIVFYGAEGHAGAAELIEVHVHLTRGRVVTVHRRPSAVLRRLETAGLHSDHEVVYRILDSLSESVLAVLREIEQEVNGLEQRSFEQPSAADRRRIVNLRGRLFRLMQVILPMRDMLDSGAEAIERVLGMESGEAHHPFHDVRDDLVLAVNLIAYSRELLAEALNVYLQTTSNRLNEVATRLTVLATIFVPLTLITGFFGQNFGWLVAHIDSFASFLVLGLGGTVLPALLIWGWLRRAGYLNSGGQ
ncbi:MAG TPA: magnesium transporter CorA family protein [Solirubrobacteraceae bacterium]|nr:magnesium transporter CorA family protein [Solirubrobacteraceae bacterium]